MLELCRKRTLARSISAMATQFLAHYQFCPQTYVLPEDLPSLLKDFKSSKKGAPKTLILKPDSGSQVHSTTSMLLNDLEFCPCIETCSLSEYQYLLCSDFWVLAPDGSSRKSCMYGSMALASGTLLCSRSSKV